MRSLKGIQHMKGHDQNARAAFGQVDGYGVKIALILEGIDDGRGHCEGGSKAIKKYTMGEN
jgi:hypothetical protein